MIRKVGHSKSIVKGEAEIENVNQELDLNLDEQGDYETISGFILSHLRHIPETGEELKIDNVVIRITKADEKRIVEVEIEKRSDIEESSP